MFDALRSHQLERIPMNSRYAAAVLIPLIRRENQWNVLFEIRAANILQAGEICFPGGRIEPGETSAQTVVRETCEELLLSPSQIDVICPMHQMSGPGGQDVTSFLGYLSDYNNSWSKAEVEKTFLLPLSWFTAHPPRQYQAELVTRLPDDFPFDEIDHGKEYPFRSIPKTFYFYTTPYGTLWGMTAQLMHAALPVLLSPKNCHEIT